MQVSCPRCRRVLEYSGDRPVFCAYCGQPLEGDDGSDPRLLATVMHEPKSVAVAETDPDRVAGYRIVGLLGRGGMGSVYEAEDSQFGRRVALKLIAAAHVASDEAVERFRQEGRLTSTLSHPRCVFVLAADEYLGRPYIVMELMPGATLQTLVETRGALPVGEAIAKILDVIEGLQEAHFRGIIHRDVKPSNCFLESSGRVKVGDFGLSKSLDTDSGLTRSGSFIGTPLYASPEQIKRDPVDERTDLYSVAATLYFLLTGRPPFQAEDAAATLAKIVSEPPTSMRKLCPELPPSLEAAVLRGLERDPARRWQDLGRFREALLPFVPGRLGLSDMALRATAFIADGVLMLAVEWLVLAPVYAVSAADTRAIFFWLGRFTPWLLVSTRLVFLAYFTVLEGQWGASLGKRFIRLRVSRIDRGGPPGLKAAAARALTFYAVTALPGDVLTVLLFGLLPGRQAILYEPLAIVARVLGFSVIASTMRARTGFRGVHEWATGTRVVRLPRTGRRRAPEGRRLPTRPDYARDQTAHAVGVLKSVGSFRVRGAVRWDGDRRVLLGEDSTLERPVWIVLRPKGSPPPPPERRDLARPSRPRWLSGGEQAEGRWDAFTAPTGCSLADLAGPTGLPWSDARPILHDLADELARARVDGTLPDALSVEQVWIQPDGSVLLADPLGASTVSGPRVVAGEDRALDLLSKTAALALEGGRRRSLNTAPKSIRAAVPEHAARMLDRLTGRPRQGDETYGDVASVLADIEADRDKPTEVDFARRAVHLATSVGSTALLLAAMFAVSLPEGPRLQFAGPIILGVPAFGLVWSVFTRGGLLFGLAGIALVRADSRPAERWRCCWRSALVWGPVAALLFASVWSRARGHVGTSWTFWGLALTVVIVYPVLALAFPARSIHDRLSGTWLVPK